MVAPVACLVLTLYVRAWVAMLAWGAVAADLGIPTVGFLTALLVVSTHQMMLVNFRYGE